MVLNQGLPLCGFSLFMAGVVWHCLPTKAMGLVLQLSQEEEEQSAVATRGRGGVQDMHAL